VEDVSLEIGRGELLCLVGESGSGKSMTALALMGLLPERARIVSGKIHLEGRNLANLPEKEMRKLRGPAIGMVFQEPMTALDPLMKVGRQVAEAMTARGAGRAGSLKRALGLLEEVGIRDPARVSDSYPHQLSGGLRQRALIAAALACEPSLLIADEPTTALDATVSLQILGLIDKLRSSRGMGVLLITHDFGVVREVATRVAVIYAGAIVEEGPSIEILDASAHPYTRALIEALPGRSGTMPGAMLSTIPGHVPEPSRGYTGCRFGPRCAHAVPGCRDTVPVTVVNGGRRVACIRPIA
jgi:oligopeptide/dipeptide ABC transporter ATP-binding protein